MSQTPQTDDEAIDTFLTWVMANRDVSARQWTDTIEPELLRQLQQLLLAERIDEHEKWLAMFEQKNDVAILNWSDERLKQLRHQAEKGKSND